MSCVIWCALAAFALAVLFGKLVMPWLIKLKFGQTIYDLGPQSHKKKQGTPTMGGVIFAVPAILAAVIFSYKNGWEFLSFCVVSTLGFGLIGFVDDFIKVSKHRSLGLTPKQKLVPQIILGIALACWAYFDRNIGPKLIFPYLNVEFTLGIFYIPIMAFIAVGTVNSSNLLDGLDGLLAGCSAYDFAAMAIICAITGIKGGEDANYMSTAVFSAAMAGALMGFLIYNAHPAKVFMGDIGSFFIGGALMGVMMVTRLSLLLPIIAFAMLISTVSDLIQFAYFRATHGKRIFKMAPLHHHFELSGMAETHVTVMYHIGTILLCLLALIGFVG